MDPVVAILAVLVMVIGLIGVVVPVMPGLLIVWLVAVGTTLWSGTDAVGWMLAGVLTVLFVIGTGASILLPARQGRRGGAPTSSLAAALLGALVGFFVIPVAGLLVGAAVGYLLAELRRLGSWGEAVGSLGTVIRAYGIGVLIELVVGVVMIGTWMLAVLLR